MNRIIKPAGRLEGEIEVPGDKSITHRAYILGSLCPGEVQIENISPARDCLSTLNCLESLGVKTESNDSTVLIKGAGLFGLKCPAGELDAGNSGTTARLLCGVLAGQHYDSIITGDGSLKRRPMQRIINPLSVMGGRFEFQDGGLLPVKIQGRDLHGVEHSLPLPSAQVKSALLLAGLLAEGETGLTGEIYSRDHTERMLYHLGAKFERAKGRLLVKGRSELTAQKVVVPGDISSAVFFVVAAILLHDSRVVVKDVGLNPTRTAGLTVLKRMGADITIQDEKSVNNEPIATIISKSSELRATEILAPEIPGLIDEIPILALAATQAKGITSIRGASELRVKESDRLSALTGELRKMGARIRELPDGLEISGPSKLKGAMVNTWKDHRIAMALTVAGLIAAGGTCITESEWVEISFPDFFELLGSVTIR